MTVLEVAEKLNLRIFTAQETAKERNVKGCYIGDLLSLAMSKVEMDNAWITIQTNVNITAVAALTDAACVILADGFEPEVTTIERANEQNIIILGGEISAYNAAIGLAELGI